MSVHQLIEKYLAGNKSNRHIMIEAATSPKELLKHLDKHLPYPHSWESVDRGFDKAKIVDTVEDAVLNMIGPLPSEKIEKLRWLGRATNWLAFARNTSGLEGKAFYENLSRNMSKRDFVKGLQAFIDDSSSIPGLNEPSVPPEAQKHAEDLEKVVSRSRLEIVDGPHFNVFYNALTLKYKDMEISLSQSEMMNLKAIQSLSRYIEETYKVAQDLYKRNRRTKDVWYDDIAHATSHITGRGKGKSLIYSAIAQYLKDQGIHVHS